MDVKAGLWFYSLRKIQETNKKSCKFIQFGCKKSNDSKANDFKESVTFFAVEAGVLLRPGLGDADRLAGEREAKETMELGFILAGVVFLSRSTILPPSYGIAMIITLLLTPTDTKTKTMIKGCILY